MADIAIRTLEMHPAFGFETDARFQCAAHAAEAKGKSPQGHRMWARPTVDTINSAKAFGYLPIINVIIGIASILFFSNSLSAHHSEEDKAQAKKFIIRSVLMILIGPLLLIPDAILTIRDAFAVKAYMAMHPEAAKIKLHFGNYIEPRIVANKA